MFKYYRDEVLLQFGFKKPVSLMKISYNLSFGNVRIDRESINACTELIKAKNWTTTRELTENRLLNTMIESSIQTHYKEHLG